PSATRRTETFFSAIPASFHLLVQFAHHHCLDLGQQLGGDQGVEAQRLRQCERRAHVPSDDGARRDPQLAAEALGQVPDLPALDRQRPVQSCGAVRAGACAGRAVAVAPAEGPVGEGAEAFFSASSIRPRATYCAWKASNTGQISRRASIPAGLTGTRLPSSSPTPSQSRTARRATALAMASAMSSWLELADRLSMAGSARAETMSRSEEHTSELQSRENLVCRL